MLCCSLPVLVIASAADALPLMLCCWSYRSVLAGGHLLAKVLSQTLARLKGLLAGVEALGQLHERHDRDRVHEVHANLHHQHHHNVQQSDNSMHSGPRRVVNAVKWGIQKCSYSLWTFAAVNMRGDNPAMCVCVCAAAREL